MITIADIERCLTQGSETKRGDHDLTPGLQPPSDLRPASVLIGLVPRPDGMQVLFTKRTDNLEHHPGQICFPGGHVEPSDTDAMAAAIRESQEEIGLDQRHITVLGRIDTYVTRTGFAVTPIVAAVQPPFSLRADPKEVADIFEVPLAFLMNPQNHKRHEKRFSGKTHTFYAIGYEDYYIWGATAGMVVNLYQYLLPSLMDETPAT